MNSTDTFEAITRNSTFANEALTRWKKTKTGPLSTSPFNLAAWVRLQNDSPILQRLADPSAGPHTAHFELMISVSLANFGKGWEE